MTLPRLFAVIALVCGIVAFVLFAIGDAHQAGLLFCSGGVISAGLALLV